MIATSLQFKSSCSKVGWSLSRRGRGWLRWGGVACHDEVEVGLTGWDRKVWLVVN